MCARRNKFSCGICRKLRTSKLRRGASHFAPINFFADFQLALDADSASGAQVECFGKKFIGTAAVGVIVNHGGGHDFASAGLFGKCH